MTRSLVFLFLALIATSSCNSEKAKTPEQKTSLVGRWHRFSMANGYTEFEIDSQFVVFFNQKVGRFKLPYKIENDSIKYLTSKYAAKITHYGDSVFLEGNDSTTATLHRFSAQAAPFKSIPEEKDSATFALYVKGFDERLIREFEKVGIQISDNMPKADDAGYEQLLKKKDLQGR